MPPRAQGSRFKENAAFQMLACTPSIRQWPRTPSLWFRGGSKPSAGFRGPSHWVGSTLAEAAGASVGFFRIQRDWDWISLIKSSEQDAALIDDRAGRMAAAAKCKVVRWTRTAGCCRCRRSSIRQV